MAFIKGSLLRAVIALSLANIYCETYSQQHKTIYRIGDTVPNLRFENIINQTNRQLQLSDIKKRIVIIDFWASWCSPCVGSFKKLDSLQKEFNQDVQIIPVTYEDSKATYIFLKKIEKQYGILPISVTKDIELAKMFPHKTLPHYVWIGQNRKVIAITEGKDVNRKNLMAACTSGIITYTKKEDDEKVANRSSILRPSIEYINLDKSRELVVLGDSVIPMQSVLTKFIEGTTSGVDYGSQDAERGYIFARNKSILGLYRVALFGNSLSVLNTTLFEVKVPDSSLYEIITGYKLQSGIETANWLKKNGYCYQLRASKQLNHKRFDIMLSDLNRYFGSVYNIEGVIESIEKPYLALIRTETGDITRTDGSGTSVNDKFTLKIKNKPIASLINQLALPLQSYPPVYDETNYAGNIDIELNCKLSDLTALNDELAKYGLRLVEKRKYINVAVVRMKNK